MTDVVARGNAKGRRSKAKRGPGRPPKPAKGTPEAAEAHIASLEKALELATAERERMDRTLKSLTHEFAMPKKGVSDEQLLDFSRRVGVAAKLRSVWVDAEEKTRVALGLSTTRAKRQAAAEVEREESSELDRIVAKLAAS